MTVTDPATGMTLYAGAGRSRYANMQPTPAATRPAGTLPCPFCPGNEKQSGHTLAAWGDDRAWTMRAVANAYPITPGPHNLLICSPNHNWTFHTATVDELEHIDSARRMLTSYTDNGSAWTTCWVSHGREAGASQPHTHLQMLASDTIPAGAVNELAAHTSVCPLCTDPNPVDRGDWQLHIADDGNHLIVAAAEHKPWTTPTSAGSVGHTLRTIINTYGPIAYNVVWHDTDLRLHPHAHLLRRDTHMHGAGVIEQWRTRTADPAAAADHWRTLLGDRPSYT